MWKVRHVEKYGFIGVKGVNCLHEEVHVEEMKCSNFQVTVIVALSTGSNSALESQRKPSTLSGSANSIWNKVDSFMVVRTLMSLLGSESYNSSDSQTSPMASVIG